MKKIISLICALSVAFSCAAPMQMIASADSVSSIGTMSNLAGLAYAPVNAFDMNSDMTITIEAEKMVSSTNMTVVDDKTASGEKAMKFTGSRGLVFGQENLANAFNDANGNSVKPNPDLLANINIPTTNAYQVWARVKAADTNLTNYPMWHRFDNYGKYIGNAGTFAGYLYNLPSTDPKKTFNIPHGTTTASNMELHFTQYPFKYRLKFVKHTISSDGYTWIPLINRNESVTLQKSKYPNLTDVQGNALTTDSVTVKNPGDYQYMLMNGNREFSLMFSEAGIIIDKIIMFPSNYWDTNRFTPTDNVTFPTGEKYQVFRTDNADFPEMKLAGIHPRLFITAEEIPDYKKKLTTEDIFATTWQNIQKFSAQDIDCLLPEDNRECDNHKSKLDVLEARALMYLIGEADKAHARKTVQELKNFMATVVFQLGTDGNDTTYNTRNIGSVMTTAALVYDWCYDVLTYADKEYIITRIKEIATDREHSWPPVRQSLISGHRQEETVYLHDAIVGIATYDENPDWYNIAMSAIYDRMRDIRIFGAQSGYDHSAGSYFDARNRGSVALDKMLHVTGGLEEGETIFGEDYKNVFDQLLYRGLPNGVWFKDGDDYQWDSYDGKTKIFQSNYITTYMGDTYNNPYILAEGIQGYAYSSSRSSSYSMDVIETFMVNPEDVETRTKFMCELPTTKLTTYPMTSMVARTGWSQGIDSPDAMVYMSMHDTYMDGHQHADTGTFQLWYKGMLTLNSGLYEYGPHYYHYHSRSIANNVLLVDNGNQDFYQLSLYSPTADNSTNDGGQKNTGLKSSSTYEGYLATLNQVDENGNITSYGENSLAYEKAHYIGPNAQTPAFSYLSSDISGAYNYQNGKVNGIGSDGNYTYAPVEKKLEDSGYERSMVFMDLYNEKFPAAFIVYDNVSALDASYDKTWLLHSEEEPAINGDKTTIMRTQKGLNGKLVNTTMYPKDVTIEKVGGEGNEFLVTGIDPDYEEAIVKEYSGVESGDSLATIKQKIKNTTGFDDYYNADGTFVPKGELNIDHQQNLTDKYTDSGSWRVEISPVTESADDIFLNAMYVTDAGTTEELPMDLVEDAAGKYVGVSVMDRIVTFAKTRDNINEEITLTIPDKGYDKVYCLITDMEAGKWKITGNNTTLYVNSKGDTGAVDDNTGEYSLCFEAAPGTYTIAPTTDADAVTVLTMQTVAKAQYGDFRVISGGNLINLTKPTKLVDGNSDSAADYYVALDDLVKLFGGDAKCTVDGDAITITAIGAKDDGTLTKYQFAVGSTSYTKGDKAGNYKFTKPPLKIDGNIYMDLTEFRDILDIDGSYSEEAKLLTLTYHGKY